MKAVIHYRIELSRTRKGFARVQLPGREIAIEAKGRTGPEWEVLLTEVGGERPGNAASGTVEVRADDDNDAVWLVARAAIRAVSELTGAELTGTELTDTELTGSPVGSEMAAGTIKPNEGNPL